jgi:signal peptidase I
VGGGDHLVRRTWRIVAALVASLAVVRAAARSVERVEVGGASMAPALLPGDRLLVVRPARLRPGDLVVVADPRAPGRPLVKRVGAAPGGAVLVGRRVLAAGPGEVVVLGDNSDGSTDSRTFGPVPVASVQGRPVYRYAPPGRTGRL